MHILSNILLQIQAFYQILRQGKWKTPWFQATFCLFIMGSQWVMLEGLYGISRVKVIYMCLTPLFMLLFVGKLKWDAIELVCIVYFGLVCLSAFVFSNGASRPSSVCYMFLFLLTYCYYMSLIYSGAFSYDFYLFFLRGMLCAYMYLLILQQVTAILHIAPFFRLFNCHGFPWGWKFPGMNIEPSHASRMVLGIFIALVELLNVRNSAASGLQYLWKYEKKSLFAFCYFELTNGSSSGMVAFLLMALYVLYHSKKTYFILGLLAFFIIVYFARDTQAMQRFIVSAQATATLEEEKILAADPSAAMRILVVTSTFRSLSPNDYGFWWGYGFDSNKGGIGILLYYGFFVYVMQLVFLFKYAFKGVFNIRFLAFALFFWATLGNVAHAWAIIMYWSATKYFEVKEKQTQLCHRGDFPTFNIQSV